MALTPGSRIGSYDILGPIGAGGMGEVYKARDSKLDRDVAIKVLPDSFAADAERLARFSREAKTLASLNHPNIAQVYGLEGTALVMELVDGDDLTVRIGRGPTPIDEALPIAKQIAEALEAAHEQGIVHRDLKPANIKLRADGTVKVLDFGLAKALDPASSSDSALMNSPTLTAHATQMGTIIGTAAYMSPEQAKGRAVDKRADIWAFGVVLFELLSGTRGYEAEDVSDTLAAVLTREVDWTKLPATTPPRLAGLLRDCLVRDPKQRLRDMGEARRVLHQLITGQSGSTIMAAPTSGVTVVARPAPRWTRVLPWAIATAAIGVAAFALWRPSSATIASGPVTRAQTVLKNRATYFSVSRDGTKAVYTTIDPALGFHLELRQLDQLDARPLAGTENSIGAVFSPDGEWIAFSSGNKIRKVQVSGGPSITLAEGNTFEGVTWGDDDTIVYPGAQGLMRVPASGGTPVALTTVDAKNGEARHVQPQFIPGTPSLLFTVVPKTGDPQFALLDMKKGTYAAIAKGGDHGRYAASGHLLSARGGTLFALPFDLARRQARGPEAPVVENVATIAGVTGTADYAVSDNGLLFYAVSAAQAGTTMTWRDRKGNIVPLPGQMTRDWGTGSLSPDGKRLANAIRGDGKSDLWTLELARGTVTRLTFGGLNDNPIWSRDGRWIFYQTEKGDAPGLYKLLADGTGQPQLVLTGADLVPTSVTPGDTALIFSQPRTGASGRRIMSLSLTSAGATPVVVREGAASNFDGRVSPDGRWLAFGSQENGQSEVFVMPFPGPGPKTQISSGVPANSPRWSANGRELFFWEVTPGNQVLRSAAIQSTPFSAAPPQSLFSAISGTTWHPAPDGEHFLVEVSEFSSAFVTVTNWFDELRRRAPVKK